MYIYKSLNFFFLKSTWVPLQFFFVYLLCFLRLTGFFDDELLRIYTLLNKLHHDAFLAKLS